uniref:Uncharacterized protein n=1 Tax=Anguilla anguilla TaxID=7936 RepID=A0A0E9S7K3_ANGAN
MLPRNLQPRQPRLLV